MLFSITNLPLEPSSVILINLMRLVAIRSVAIFLSVYVYEYLKCLLKICTQYIYLYIILISLFYYFFNIIIIYFSTIRYESMFDIIIFLHNISVWYLLYLIVFCMLSKKALFLCKCYIYIYIYIYILQYLPLSQISQVFCGVSILIFLFLIFK